MPSPPRRAVIAARSLTYWLRDTRYGTSLVIIPIIPIFMVISLYIAGIPLNVLALVPLPIICLFLSWFVHNDVSFDNTALWLHLSTSTSGISDRLGRDIPPFLLGVLLVGLGGVGTAWVIGDWSILPAIIGLSSCVLLASLGVASVTSAALPYPTVLPGGNPFAQPQGAGGASAAVQAFSLLLPLALASPVVWLIFFGGEEWGQASTVLWAGLGIGVVSLAIGVFWGGKLVDRHAPELLEFTLQN